MRGSSSTWRTRALLDPARAVELLVDEDEPFALLEATDGSGPSFLLLGELIGDGALPRIPFEPDGSEPVPAYAGWVAYEGRSRWLRVSRSLALDPDRRTATARGDTAWLQRVRAAVEDAGGEGFPEAGDPEAGDPEAGDPEADGQAVPGRRRPVAVWRHDDARYLELIAACQAAIVRGDAYQLCLTNQAVVSSPPDPWTVYRRLRLTSRTHHAGFLRLGDTTLVSASPERFLEVGSSGVARSSPIKGTRPRGADAARDAALAAELVADEKERAENLMIVDLVRNDLSRVAELGTVGVTRLLEVESYPNVHQLVSTIEACLRAGLGAADAVEALFPAGSMTGAPKLSAMTILRELEQGPRGLYSGVFGLLRSDGSADLAMTIRSIVFADGVAAVGAGGGITALSRPEAELAEMHLKAAPLLAALADG